MRLLKLLFWRAQAVISTLRHEKVSPSAKVRLSVQFRCMSRDDPQKLTWHSTHAFSISLHTLSNLCKAIVQDSSALCIA